MTEDKPLVTIITPTYNRADYLEETIRSVLNQDYPNLEYIVLDDGSEDNTIEILTKYNDRIIWSVHANVGETPTVNKGFEMAKGEFICVVNSDDPILPSAITKMVTALMADPDALVVYPDWVEVDPLSKPIKEMRLPNYDIYNMLTDFNVAMGPGNIFKTSVLKKYGLRDTKRRYTGDLEFWFRLASHGKLIHVPEVLATHRTHPNSASVSQKGSRMAVELVSMAENLFNEGHLPTELVEKRKQIMSRVYYIASFYCPQEPLKKIRYLLVARFCHFGTLIEYCAQMILTVLQPIGTFLSYIIKFFLKMVLPRRIYLRILSGWMRFKGKNNHTRELV